LSLTEIYKSNRGSMAKFIKLTEVFGDGQTKPVIINSDQISSIQKGKNVDVWVGLINTKYFFVKESIDYIWNELNDRPLSTQYRKLAQEG
jgi:hypothetical protein